MTPERWQQIKAIFDGAVEVEPAARADFLSQRCGSDGQLRREVESLLASDSGPTSSLSRPTYGAAVPAPLSGVLKDRYELGRELGRGGMSVVYLARDRQLLSKKVVVKVLHEGTDADPWMRQKFQQEMEALARIEHPSVVGVLDSGWTVEGKQFLVMQYVDGETLRSAIQQGRMNLKRAADLIRQVGRGLGAAHEQGVWHRDLKPENIMLQQLSGEEHVKLIDFGIAGIQNSQFGGQTSKIAGTLTYMAPEQFVGHPCAASDTYALGVVAYEMLTGVKPFSVDSMVHLVAEEKMRPAPPLELRPELPKSASRSIQKAMSFRPELRHAEVREFSEELYRALGEAPNGGVSTRKPASPGTVEIAHVMFTDVIDYSLLPSDEQGCYLDELQRTVQATPQFCIAEANDDLIHLPANGGMALAFFGDPTAPAQCALEIAASLISKPHLKVRIGIHSGPVCRAADVNANTKLAGSGIDMAQCVMECADAGQILLSKSVADALMQLNQWAPYVTDLGEYTLKQARYVHLYNLATVELGNSKRPSTLAGRRTKAKSHAVMASIMALILIAVTAIGWLLRNRMASRTAQEQASIAVLPFRDMSPEKNQEYFSEGLTDELLNALSSIRGLQVASRTNSFRFKSTNEDSRVIGDKLHVGAILIGSVRRHDNRMIVMVQLIKTADGFQIWSEKYDRELNDIFTVQEEIARAVTGTMKIKLLGQRAAPAERSNNVEAYTSYLQGRYFLRRSSKDNLEKAVAYFEQASRLDPNYAPAWVGLAESRDLQASHGYISTDEGYQRARDAVERALMLDHDLASAHATLGRIKMTLLRDWSGAEASYQRALLLAPGNAGIVSNTADLARKLGHLDEAISLARRVTQIDPLSVGGFHNTGIALYYAGRYEEATTAFKKALELVPEKEFSHGMLVDVYLAQGQPREAMAEADKEPNAGIRLCSLALVYHALGRQRESDASLAKLKAEFSKGFPYQIAEVYAFRGEADQAFEWLDRAHAERDTGLTEMKRDPLLTNIIRDARYMTLLKQMRLAD